MAVKKTQLYASLWASCDKLRGGMDSSEYKDYILTLLFMKYVTDKFKNKGAYEDIKVSSIRHTTKIPIRRSGRAAPLMTLLRLRERRTSARAWIRSLPVLLTKILT